MAVEKQVLGRAEVIDFPKLDIKGVPARIDTGAKTSSLWASSIKIDKDGRLSFCFFGKKSPLYTGKRITVQSYDETVVSTSSGVGQRRYKIKLSILINGRRIRASFTLANRSRVVYPVLIGRNVLRGRFVVDVTRGKPLKEAEKHRTQELRKLIK